MKTLYLNPITWDLTVDSSSNIAVASDPYSIVQDAASAVRTYLGEVYFNTTIGIPYSTQILGQGLPLELYRTQVIRAALTVPGVTSAQLYFTQLSNRELEGQLQITTSSGARFGVNINSSGSPTNIFTLDQSFLNGSDLLG